MKIAIGSTRGPKVEGVKLGVIECPYFKGQEVEFLTFKVESGVSDMPLSFNETMLGAKNRAEILKKSGIEADFYVGLEGGASMIGEKAYLFGVGYIESQNGEGHFGISNMIEIPKKIETALYKEKKELCNVINELSGKTGVKDNGGTFYELTDGMFERTDEFKKIFELAISPFFNQFYK
ncbi:MAG: inosine/xanthosine triphosphatase [Candidatus Gracilibacteria bacterium]|nr:inosine/xanthosine triphosphatase [Candidatus Gracilibacteria bacterium]MDD3120471.1 inosine/xanthosine triphosphatase [Candidatus Gracilibacteria bacterium]MDD4530398.1 inosine/xanthosine triphosphatase [Candidatus Gracilibacteria bacterium]